MLEILSFSDMCLLIYQIINEKTLFVKVYYKLIFIWKLYFYLYIFQLSCISFSAIITNLSFSDFHCLVFDCTRHTSTFIILISIYSEFKSCVRKKTNTIKSKNIIFSKTYHDKIGNNHKHLLNISNQCLPVQEHYR